MANLKIHPKAQPWVGRLVRLGYLAKGVIYTLISVLALRVAFGMRGGRLTDPGGALLQILRQPFGTTILAIIGIGIVAYAAYYIFEAIADLRHKGNGVRGWTDRSLTIIKAVFYGAVGVQAMAIVLIGDTPRNDPEKQARTLMHVPFGWILLVLIGAGVAIYGVTQLRMAWRGGADDDIDVSRVRREARWVLPFGRVGRIGQLGVPATYGDPGNAVTERFERCNLGADEAVTNFGILINEVSDVHVPGRS